MTKFVITLDMDWAPDWIVSYVASILINHNVRATWFVTHFSPVLERLRQMVDLFELGIHPNCLPASTHGNTENEVLKHIKKIVPEAISMRTHGLYQTSMFLLKSTKDYGIEIDVSLLLPGVQYIRPHELKWKAVTLKRIPYFWDDSLEMFRDLPVWDLSNPKYQGPGLKIFNFHPVHIYLNTVNPAIYKELKQHTPQLAELTPEIAKSFIHEGDGPQTLFQELINNLDSVGESFCIRDICKAWVEGHFPDEKV